MSETKWAIVWRGAGPQGSDWWMLSPNGHRAPDFDETSKRHLFDEPQSAGEWLDRARVEDPEHRSLLRVVRITRKPRLSPEADAVRELARQRDEAVAHGEREPSIVVPTATWLEMVKEQDALSKTMRDLNDGCVELRAEAEREKARADKAEATLRAQLAETKTQATAPDDGHPAMAPAYPGAPPVYGPLRARPLTAVVHKIAAEEPKPERVGLNPNTVMHSCVMCGAVRPRRATSP